jgi:hypothetical protein
MAIAGEEIAACHDDTEEIEEARGRLEYLADIPRAANVIATRTRTAA